MFVVRQASVDGRIAHDDLTGDPSEQATAEHHEDREPVEHTQHELAAEHDQGNADHQPDCDQEHAAMGRGGDRHDVVE